MFLAQVVALVAAVEWLRRRLTSGEMDEERRRRRQQIGGGVLALASVALVAGMGGYLRLARAIEFTLIGAAQWALVLWALVRISDAFVAWALRVRPLRLLRAVQEHRTGLERRLQHVFHLLAGVFWAISVASVLAILGPLTQRLTASPRGAAWATARSTSRSATSSPSRSSSGSPSSSRAPCALCSRRTSSRASASAAASRSRSRAWCTTSILLLGFLLGLGGARDRSHPHHDHRRRARRRRGLRPPERREQLRLRADPALRATDPGRRLGAARHAHRRGEADRHPLEHRADVRGRRGDRAERQPGVRPGHELDAVGPHAPHRSRRRRRLRHRPAAVVAVLDRRRASQRRACCPSPRRSCSSWASATARSTSRCARGRRASRSGSRRAATSASPCRRRSGRAGIDIPFPQRDVRDRARTRRATRLAASAGENA